MGEKTVHIVVTFQHVMDAMAFEKKAVELDLKGRIIPLPGEIGAGCGLCFAVKKGQEEKMDFMLAEMEYEGVFDGIMLY